jgi:hypothetical protein
VAIGIFLLCCSYVFFLFGHLYHNPYLALYGTNQYTFKCGFDE